ncbi:LysR family transcriptional regulator [Neisseria sp. Ec49-e6-T10]|uniref:LysR family transcriptional regulator n=1 Tax=Neisseria sp. Ec49-e6-T10 TaxID=3140744 RepID=UPI003EB7F319
MNNLLRDIVFFVEVAKHMSFSKAAEAMDMPNSSLSRRIAALEKELGLMLFHRSARKIELTEAGTVYYEQCRVLVEQAAEAKASLTHHMLEASGHLKMSIPVDFGLSYLNNALVLFSKQYPKIHMDIELSPRQIDFSTEHFDLAIRLGQLPDSRLIARKITTIEHKLYASRSYLQSKSELIRPEDLHQHNCLAMRQAETMWLLSNDQETLSIQINPLHILGNQQLLLHYALEGCGIVALGVNVVQPYVQSGRLVCVLPKYSMPERPVYVVTRGRQLPLRIQVFIDFLIEYFNK